MAAVYGKAGLYDTYGAGSHEFTIPCGSGGSDSRAHRTCEHVGANATGESLEYLSGRKGLR